MCVLSGTLPLCGGSAQRLVELLGFFDSFVDRADHVERLFWQVIEFAGSDHFEALDRVFQRNVFTWRTGKHFSNVERLRQETLHLTCACHQQLVFRRQFVHTQNRDDVAQFLVALQGHLYCAGGVVVLLTDDQRIQLARGRVQWIDRRVDTQRGDVTRQGDGRIQVTEGGCRRRIGVIIRWNVDGLDRGDRTGLGRGDALLQTAHLFGQGRLVTHCGRHTAQQCGYFGTGQREAVDVIDEEQNVLAFITERFRHGQTGQRDAQTVAWWFIHLAVDHRHFGVLWIFQIDHFGIGHLVVEVVTFAGTLAHAGKHGNTRVRLGDVVDQFHHVHGLADAGAAEQADFTAFGERAHQVDHLDAGFQQLLRWRQFVVRRRSAVDRRGLLVRHRAAFVDRVAQHVHDATQGRFAHWHHDWFAGVLDHHAAAQAVGRTQSNGTDHAVAQLLLYFQGQLGASHFQGIEYLRHRVAWKLYVHHSADTLNDFAISHVRSFYIV